MFCLSKNLIFFSFLFVFSFNLNHNFEKKIGFEENNILKSIYNFDNNNYLPNFKYPKSFFDLQNYWWLFLTGENSYYDSVSVIFDDYYKKERSPVNVFMVAISGIYKLRMEAILDKQFPLNLIKLKKYLRFIIDNQNLCEEFQLVTAIYNVTLGGGKFYFKPHKLLFLPSPNFKLGINNLNNLKKSNNYFIKTESHYFSYKYNLQYYDKVMFEDIKWLSTTYPNNPIYKFEFYKHNGASIELVTKYINENKNLSDTQKKYLCSRVSSYF